MKFIDRNQQHAFRAVAGWIYRQRSSEAISLVLLSILLGLGSGAGIWLFKRVIDLTHAFVTNLFLPALAPYGAWTRILPLIAGGLVVGLLVRYGVRGERHHGVAGIMVSVALAGGRLPYRNLPLKAAASALSIGSGASVGPEDPSVQIGANLGSFVGQRLHLTDERTRSLVAAGAAGGIAAAFNAPIAAVFFALEIILGELRGASLSVVVLTSVISAVFTQAVSGQQPAFRVPAYSFGSAWELPIYLLLGLLAGMVAALYIRGLYAARDVFARLALPAWVKPALAGAVVGATGIFFPQVLGVGYETIAEILASPNLSIGLLLILLFAKLVLTPMSIGGGFQGGVFAPSLFLGAALGGAFGAFIQNLLPGLNIVPGAFAMVGMAAVLAGAVHAPLTAILLLFEMTNDYRIILPVMFAVIISLLVSQRLVQESVYTLSLVRHGIRLERGRDVEVLEGMTVGEVMSQCKHVLAAHETLSEALELFARTHSHGFPVVSDTGELIGVLSIQDLESAQAGGSDLGARCVGDICSRKLIVAFPDEALSQALLRMSLTDVGRLPVVDRANPRRIVGLLRRSDVIRAYDQALKRHLERRHRLNQVRLSTLAHLPVEEARVEAGSSAAGSVIGAVPWPNEVIIASIRRGGKAIVPHGSTVLHPGDYIVYVAENGAASNRVRDLCRPGQPIDREEMQ